MGSGDDLRSFRCRSNRVRPGVNPEQNRTFLRHGCIAGYALLSISKSVRRRSRHHGRGLCHRLPAVTAHLPLLPALCQKSGSGVRVDERTGAHGAIENHWMGRRRFSNRSIKTPTGALLLQSASTVALGCTVSDINRNPKIALRGKSMRLTGGLDFE